MKSQIKSIDMRFARHPGWPLWLVVLLLSSVAAAQTEAADREPAWGTSESPTAKTAEFETVIGNVSTNGVFSGAQFGSGGVGLRNRGAGSISISGVITPVKAAYIYWAMITEGAAPAADKKIMVQRLYPAPASAIETVTGTLLGTGGTPCWSGNTISVFRGVVPNTLATGNGLYQVTLFAGAGGSTAGADPWLGQKLPLMEGASIVIVGSGTSSQKVAIYDTGLAGKTFHGNPGISYSLTLPAATTGTLTLFESIGADGQHGASRTADVGLGDESTVINSVYVAGPFSANNDSDWNGNSADPLPQLWDDVGHNITAATPSGTKVLDVHIANAGESSYDCMTPVANVVQEQ